MDIVDQVTTYVSLAGTCLGISSRVPQIIRVVSRQSGADLSSRALAMNIAANACFACYALAHDQWPILLNNAAVITLDGALIFLRSRYGQMKKVSSGSDLHLMVSDE
jgi:uncharacterized protein with PQ loop repeat